MVVTVIKHSQIKVNRFKSQCSPNPVMALFGALCIVLKQMIPSMSTGACQLISIVQRRYFGFTHYEILFSQTKIASFATCGIGHGFCEYFPCYGVLSSLIVEGPHIFAQLSGISF